MNRNEVTPTKQCPRSLGAIAKAIVDGSPQAVTAMTTAPANVNNDVALVVPPSHNVTIWNGFLTWAAYIESQQTFDRKRKKNPLHYVDILKQILLERGVIRTSNISMLYVREYFETLLEQLNGPYSGLQETIVTLPPQQGRQLEMSNSQFMISIRQWDNGQFGSTVKALQRKEVTKDKIRAQNVIVQELALSRSRAIELEQVAKKQAEFAEYFKNHMGDADVHVYGELRVHRKNNPALEVMDDMEVSDTSRAVYDMVTTHPASIIPLVHSNPHFFRDNLSEMEKVCTTFPLNAALTAKVQDVTKLSSASTTTPCNNDATTVTLIPFRCYVCHKEYDEKKLFVTHMKEHEPGHRQTTDNYHEQSFSMVLPTAKTIDCVGAVKLFRQGSTTSPPAVLWSKKTRQNKRVYGALKALDDYYVQHGHEAFVDTYHDKKAIEYQK